MNLPLIWADALRLVEHDAIHWSSVGPFNAADFTILRWAREHGRVIVTHDLDYGTLLAASKGSSPSVIVLRTRGASAPHVLEMLIQVIAQHRVELEIGALLIADAGRARLRILPI